MGGSALDDEDKDKGRPVNTPYTRFIPREELRHFAAWTPGSFGDSTAAAPDTPAERADLEVRLQAARQAGYQDGYRDGLAALESFKRSFAQQTSARVGEVVGALDAEFLALEQRIAQTVADTAVELARQVVRSELAARPELVVQVAHEALGTLLLSARHVTLRVHPDDEPLVAEGARDVLAARHARLLADPSVERGGCRVDADIGSVDATLATRWRRACEALGAPRAFDDDAAAEETTA